MAADRGFTHAVRPAVPCLLYRYPPSHCGGVALPCALWQGAGAHPAAISCRPAHALHAPCTHAGIILVFSRSGKLPVMPGCTLPSPQYSILVASLLTAEGTVCLIPYDSLLQYSSYSHAPCIKPQARMKASASAGPMYCHTHSSYLIKTANLQQAGRCRSRGSKSM